MFTANLFNSKRKKLLSGVVALSMVAAACTSGESGDSTTQSTVNDPTATTVSGALTSDTTASTVPPEPSVVLTGGSGYSNTGGGYLGNPIWAQSVGNVPIGTDGNNELAIRFMARDSGTTTSASYIIKFDNERDNYQGGDCGVLLVTLRPDDGTGNPAETVLTSTTVDDPCGGDRTIGWLTNLAWDTPADLIGGQPYHLVFSNIADDPVNNWVSINLLYRPNDDADALGLSTGDGELSLLSRGSTFWSGADPGIWGRSSTLNEFYPAFEIHYADDTSQGVSYIGARFGDEVTMSPESPAQLRQSFLVSTDTTVTSLHFAPDFDGTSADAAVTATLSVNSGPELVTVPLTRAAGQHWFGADLPVPLTLTAGQTYSVVVASTAGTVYVRPLYEAQHNDWISSNQSDWANTTIELDASGTGTWEPYVPGIPHDLSLYFTTADPAAGADTENAAATAEGPTIALLGDSLIGGPDFEEQFDVALASRNVAVAELLSVSGQTVAQLSIALDESVPVADIIVVANTINGEVTGPEFETQVREVVTKIRAANPDASLYWVNAFATTLKYDYIVDERVTPRNAVLKKLDAEGVIKLVDWAAVAAPNTQIFTESNDGVHFFGSQQLYTSTIVAAIDAELGR